MSFLAQVSYTGNGSTTQYSITFPYIDVTHVKAYLDGVLTTAYTISSSTLTFTTAPANGVVIRIERETPNTTRLIDFTDGSVLTESDLDASADQNFYIAQEITDDSASKLGLDTDDKYDANNKVIKNLANPVNNNDAVNKQFISTNLPNITTVAGISADVTTVAGISGNVTTVAGNNANVYTVATNIASVNTVATNIADVITVANDLNEAISEIETTANDLNEAVSEIDTVGTNIASVQTVGTDIANVNTVAGSIANVNSVAGNSTNINAVAGNATNINAVNANSSNINAVNANSANINTVAGNNANVSTVAGISGNVTTVAGISADVTAVAGDATDIGTVATDIADVSTVAGSIANVNSVATNIANVTTVAGISANVTAVAGDATDIGTVASNLSGTNTIGTVAGSIANVNTVGGSIANVNTVATNIASVNNFGEVYRISATAPTTSLNSGDLYFDTTTNILNVYGASGWQNAGSSVNGTSERFNYTATSGQTTFTGADNNGNTLAYDAGYIDVYLNGVKLLNGTDVTVTSGTSIVLASGATAGDVLDIVTYGTFSIATLNADNLSSGTVPDARITGAYTGITNLTMSGNLGIGTSSPSTKLHVVDGAIQIESTSATGNAWYYAKNADRTWLMGCRGSSSDVLSFYDLTADAERMRIDSSGRVGIGTSSPLRDLHVSNGGAEGYEFGAGELSNVNQTLHYNRATSQYIAYQQRASQYQFDINTSEKMRIDSSGNVGIGTSSPASLGSNITTLEITGGSTIRQGGIYLSNSDKSVKSYFYGTNALTVLATESNIPLAFSTNNTERMRIDTNGGIHAGVSNTSTAPQFDYHNDSQDGNVARFHNNTTTRPYGLAVTFGSASPDDNTRYAYFFTDSTAARFAVYSDGDVKNHDNSYGALSDERIKQDIRDSNSQWNDIKNIRVRNFKKKDDVRQYGENAWEQIGVIAQEIEQVSPKLIKHSDPTPSEILSDASFGTLYQEGDEIPEGKKVGDVKEIHQKVKGVSYSVLYMKSIKALQEAMERIETLEAKITALENK